MKDTLLVHREMLPDRTEGIRTGNTTKAKGHKMIRNIVFDFGGVIADLDIGNAISAFKSLGIWDVEKYLDPYLQNGPFLEVENGMTDAQGFIAEISGLSGNRLTYSQVQKAWLAFITGVSLDKLAYILALRKHYRTYLLSNTNPFIMGWACSERFPGNRPLDAYFDKMYFSYMIGRTKPDREIFMHMIQDSGMKPEETLFVEDGSANIATARRLGFATYRPENGEDWTKPLNGILGISEAWTQACSPSFRDAMREIPKTTQAPGPDCPLRSKEDSPQA